MPHRKHSVTRNCQRQTQRMKSRHLILIEFAAAQAEMDKLRLEKTGTFREHYNWRKGTDWTLLQLKKNWQNKLTL